jgi:hypothetical protein
MADGNSDSNVDYLGLLPTLVRIWPSFATHPHVPPATPEKRKVGGSTPPLTTSSGLRQCALSN